MKLILHHGAAYQQGPGLSLGVLTLALGFLLRRFLELGGGLSPPLPLSGAEHAFNAANIAFSCLRFLVELAAGAVDLQLAGHHLDSPACFAQAAFEHHCGYSSQPMIQRIQKKALSTGDLHQRKQRFKLLVILDVEDILSPRAFAYVHIGLKD